MEKLIHLTSHLRPGGGPPGYLYNLQQVSQTVTQEFFEVVSEFASDERTVGVQDRFALPDFLNRHLRPIKAIVSLLGFLPSALEVHVDRKNVVLCAHTAPLAARLIRKRRTQQRIFLMPHAPVSYSDELMNEFDLRFGKGRLSGVYRRILNHIEWTLFQKVDGLIVACKEGLQDYFPGRSIKNKIYEVLSGVPAFSIKHDKHEVRADLNLPSNKTVFGFFGRFNEDKGFDLFMKVAQKLSNRDDLLFICAGAGPLLASDQRNFINFGWRSDIDRLISACDAVVVSNKHTYFDLLPLEVLSTSRPVIASRTGGNLKLAFLSSAVELFDRNEKDLERLIQRISDMPLTERHELEAQAFASYQKYFSMERFLDHHMTLANQVLQDNSHSEEV